MHVRKPLRRPPAIIPVSSEDEDEEGGGHQDGIDIDQEANDESDHNDDLKELGSTSLRQKMASEVCAVPHFKIYI